MDRFFSYSPENPHNLLVCKQGCFPYKPELNALSNHTGNTDISGVENIGEDLEGLMVTNDVVKFQWKANEKLHVPENALPEGVSEYSVNIKASLAGQFGLPKGCELASVVPECVLLLKWLQKDKTPDPQVYKVKLLKTGKESDFPPPG